jgi:hypothetical protein
VLFGNDVKEHLALAYVYAAPSAAEGADLMSVSSASGLSWTSVREYLLSRGFRLLPTGWTDAGVFRHGDVEVVIPFDTTFADYAEALERAAGKIARFEGRAIADVVADLAMPRADRVRFAQTGEGPIGMGTAPDLLDGARKTLLSAAQSEERPELRFHVGHVVELKGDVNDEGRLEGDVVLRLDADEELIRARCWLGPDDYLKAHDAHGRQRPVSVHGRLTRAGRTYTLEDPRDLKAIE